VADVQKPTIPEPGGLRFALLSDNGAAVASFGFFILSLVVTRVFGFKIVIHKEHIDDYLIAGGFFGVVLAYAYIRATRLIPSAWAMLELFMTWQGALLLQYPALATARPLIDRWLAPIDRAVGFDWVAYFHVIWTPPLYAANLEFVYNVLLTQQALILSVVVGFLKPHRLQRFVIANVIVLSVTLIIVAFFPAEGPLIYLHAGRPLDPHNQFEVINALRDGDRTINFGWITGMLFFPSYHAALAVLSACLVWTLSPWIVVPTFIVEASILIAAPPLGFHWMTDVVAGAVLAVVAWRCTRWIPRRSQPQALA
jgi:hypothetical protein